MKTEKKKNTGKFHYTVGDDLPKPRRVINVTVIVDKEDNYQLIDDSEEDWKDFVDCNTKVVRHAQIDLDYLDLLDRKAEYEQAHIENMLDNPEG